MVNVYYVRVRDVKKPFKKYQSDSGFDLYVPKIDRDLIKNSRRIPESANGLRKVEDFFDIEKQTIRLFKGEALAIPSGIRMILPEGYDAKIEPRSSSILKGILSQSVIDCGYSGEFKLVFFNPTKYDIEIRSGERWLQLLIQPRFLLFNSLAAMEEILYPQLIEIDEKEFEELEKRKDRKKSGFGSSGRT